MDLENNYVYNDECPICLTNKPDCLTNCNHSFCVKCVSKTSTCALCRTPLLIYKMCKEMKDNHFKKPKKCVSTNHIGVDIISSIHIPIGGALVERHYNYWHSIYNMLSIPAELRSNMDSSFLEEIYEIYEIPLTLQDISSTNENELIVDID